VFFSEHCVQKKTPVKIPENSPQPINPHCWISEFALASAMLPCHEYGK